MHFPFRGTKLQPERSSVRKPDRIRDEGCTDCREVSWLDYLSRRSIEKSDHGNCNEEIRPTLVGTPKKMSGLAVLQHVRPQPKRGTFCVHLLLLTGELLAKIKQ